MDDRRGIFGNYGGSSANIPAGGYSPYTSFDPGLLADSQYILPEGAAAKRGRLELTFGIVGGAVMMGGTLGGVTAIPSVLKEWNSGKAKAVARSSARTIFTKSCASGGQTWGSAAMLYSILVVLSSKLRGVDDEFNTLGSGALAGAIFYSFSGWKRSLGGCLGGLGIAALYCYATDPDGMKRLARR